MFLTKQELFELTETHVRQKQIAWLEARAYKYDIGSKGGIKVYAKAVEDRMYLSSANRKKPLPNFEALKTL